MRRLTAGVLAGVVLALMTSACGGWSRRDTLMELGVATTFVVDYRQSDAAIDRSRKSQLLEANPIIGEHGENISASGYFLTTGLLHVVVAALLPPRWRTTFQAVTIGYEVYLIRNNHELFEWARNRYDAPGTSTLSAPTWTHDSAVTAR